MATAQKVLSEVAGILPGLSGPLGGSVAAALCFLKGPNRGAGQRTSLPGTLPRSGCS